MSQPVIDEVRKLGIVLERIAAALERATGLDTPQATFVTPTPRTPGRPAPVVQRQGEPVRAPVPPTRAAQGDPPPAKMGPRCNANGPVYVGSVAIRCSDDAGHDGPHSHAGYEWANEAATEGASTESTT